MFEKYFKPNSDKKVSKEIIENEPMSGDGVISRRKKVLLSDGNEVNIDNVISLDETNYSLIDQTSESEPLKESIPLTADLQRTPSNELIHLTTRAVKDRIATLLQTHPEFQENPAFIRGNYSGVRPERLGAEESMELNERKGISSIEMIKIFQKMGHPFVEVDGQLYMLVSEAIEAKNNTNGLVKKMKIDDSQVGQNVTTTEALIPQDSKKIGFRPPENPRARCIPIDVNWLIEAHCKESSIDVQYFEREHNTTSINDLLSADYATAQITEVLGRYMHDLAYGDNQELNIRQIASFSIDDSRSVEKKRGLMFEFLLENIKKTNSATVEDRGYFPKELVIEFPDILSTEEVEKLFQNEVDVDFLDEMLYVLRERAKLSTQLPHSSVISLNELVLIAESCSQFRSSKSNHLSKDTDALIKLTKEKGQWVEKK